MLFRSVIAAERQKRADEERVQIIREWEERGDSGLTVQISNATAQTIHYKLYSMNRPGHVWPEVDQSWISGSGNRNDANITCKVSEKICVGAVLKNGGSTYWGVGPEGKASCTSCCFTCDGRRYNYGFGD